MLNADEEAAVAERFGVARSQVRRDHLISHLLAALSANAADQVVLSQRSLRRRMGSPSEYNCSARPDSRPGRPHPNPLSSVTRMRRQPRSPCSPGRHSPRRRLWPWFNRSAPRDLFDLWLLTQAGALDSAAAQLFARHGPTNRPPAELFPKSLTKFAGAEN